MTALAITGGSESDEVLRAANEVIDGLRAECLSLGEDLRIAHEQLAAFDGLQYASHYLKKDWKYANGPVVWVVCVEYEQQARFDSWIEAQLMIRALREKARQLRPHANGRHIT